MAKFKNRFIIVGRKEDIRDDELYIIGKYANLIGNIQSYNFLRDLKDIFGSKFGKKIMDSYKSGNMIPLKYEDAIEVLTLIDDAYERNVGFRTFYSKAYKDGDLIVYELLV